MMKYRIIYFTALLTIISLAISEQSSAQKRRRRRNVAPKEVSIYDIDTLLNPIPLNRKMWHDKIDRVQRGSDASDGRVDGTIYYAEDINATNLLTQSMLKDVDRMQIMIENLPPDGQTGLSESQVKIRYLTYLYDMVRRFNADSRAEPVFYRRVVYNFHDLLIARHEHKVNEFVSDNANIYTLTNSDLLEGYPDAKAKVYVTVGEEDPVKMIRRLAEFAKEPFACDIIAAAAKVVPNEVYNYASSSNYLLSGAVRRCKDPLVQTIVRIADDSKSPLKAMSFLSDIHNGRMTIAEIDKITSNPDLFYKNLVRLKLQNEALGGDTYTDELKYRGLKYVREMNDLHTEKDLVRFKCIEGFKPEELYFLMVYGQDEIYTSSFLGTFKRMMAGMDTSMKGDMLLEKVHYDKFRTFLRMCAGYNTLGTFLASMEADKKTRLMRDFIANLDKGKDDDLEDAVDVADAFGSIDDQPLIDFLKKEVRDNYEKSYKEKSMKGMRVYALLATLFDGLKASDNSEMLKQQSEVLNLPPINMVQEKNLMNDSGIVYEQVFFYGDEDGKASFASFQTNFKDGKWKAETNKNWVTYTTTAGKPVVVFANLPLAEPADEEAQKALQKYLEEKEIMPSIIIHRGHSYHLPSTLDYLTKNTRIVMLGSCGGYHNLGTVLDHSPDAHIISSKQTGGMNVNEPIIKAIHTRLQEGKDVEWVSMWKELQGYFASKPAVLKDMFDDYVPPHKNLGAIFIKAYRRLTSTEASNEDEEL
jgi:hypothetical protein